MIYKFFCWHSQNNGQCCGFFLASDIKCINALTAALTAVLVATLEKPENIANDVKSSNIMADRFL